MDPRTLKSPIRVVQEALSKELRKRVSRKNECGVEASTNLGLTVY